MTEQRLDDDAIQKIVRIAADPKHHPITASADGMVSVTVGTNLQVTSVIIQHAQLEDNERSRLEKAIVTAMNDAVQQVSKRYVDSLHQVVRKPGT